ncbi:MAG: phosphoenolpyruvate carboxykinase (GTP) [Chloroflexota bacterium]|nr:phosphoenolpyruvate carboxykinase (GTP) [Chloroflexota bacterium]
MDEQTVTVLKDKLGETGFQKLIRIDNPSLYQFIAKYIELCNPANVFVCTDSSEDIDYIRQSAINKGEEIKLALEGHTVHFDAYGDQGRDKDHTYILVPKGVNLGSSIRTYDRDKGHTEVHEILKNIMQGKDLYVRFFCLGPTNSEFSVPCIQLTDSAYVAHSEDILYRQGYEEFVRQGASARFFKFVHSQGEIDEQNVSKNLDKRRIYIDITESAVYSTNTQYGGNTIGLKKLAMRLAINRASKEGWLTEHMLVMGVHGPKDRVSYFTGAYPSMCGKTSTAMMDGETIVGDDIAYLRKRGGEIRAVNVEKGMFGIIRGVNEKDDLIQWNVLKSPGELIVSNVLYDDAGDFYWIGMGTDIPDKGYNHSGEWFLGKKDAKGKKIPCSHPNARFTLDLHLLPNLDPMSDDPKGVVVKGVVYGGRDSDTCVPVEEAFDWTHGIITKGAALESETTAATLGKEGVRAFNPMANLDFLSVPIDRYIYNNLNFGTDLKNSPAIFSVNYFIKGEDEELLNGKSDKKVWFKWMELRVNGEVETIETPTGRIPKYEDLVPLFKSVLQYDYSQKEYEEQFTVRVPEHLAKIDRITKIYQTRVSDTPEILFETLEAQRQRLLRAREKHGDYITPDQL